MEGKKKFFIGMAILLLAVLSLGMFLPKNAVTGDVVGDVSDHIRGDPDAPVTIIEYSDYECPFCARFYAQTFPLIEQEYIQTGKVRMIFRDFPLSFHPNAQKAAEAAKCAGEQDRYYDMHDILFEKGVSDGVFAFKMYADELGLDMEMFDSCLDSGQMAKRVQADMLSGISLGITGTPGFLINERRLSGAQPFETFKEIIESELD